MCNPAIPTSESLPLRPVPESDNLYAISTDILGYSVQLYDSSVISLSLPLAHLILSIGSSSKAQSAKAYAPGVEIAALISSLPSWAFTAIGKTSASAKKTILFKAIKVGSDYKYIYFVPFLLNLQ